MNQINTPQTYSMCFPKQKIVFKNCIQTCPNTMVFPFFLLFFFFFFFCSTFVCFLKFEQKRGHVASAVECYMNRYGVSEEQTNKHTVSLKSESRMVGWILTRNGSNLRRLFQCLSLLVLSLLHEPWMSFTKSKIHACWESNEELHHVFVQ